jgi:hypothetical protein
VHVTSEHDFGNGSHVSASYHYVLTVARDGERYRIGRSGLTLEEHDGGERLRVGNVLVQDATQHAGDVVFRADGTHIAPAAGFDPIEAAARSVLAEAGIEGPLADAVLALDRSGWEPLNVVDFDSLVHEWNGRTLALGALQDADALPGVHATRVLARRDATCGESGPPECVELVRTEQGEHGNDRMEHVYTLLAAPSTLLPYRFVHESRTDSESADVHYAETWTTTFAWR